MKQEKEQKQTNNDVAGNIRNRKRARKQSNNLFDTGHKIKILKIALLLMLIILIIAYFVLRVLFETGQFTVTLDNMTETEPALIMYERQGITTSRSKLKADSKDFITNISGDWIPEDIDSGSQGGPNNGDNYIAYTFYIENIGDETIHYWYQIDIDDVIKNVDEAIRVKIVVNDDEKIYAKPNPITGEAEKGTEKFYKNNIPVMENRTNFKPGDIDKITIFIWLEGDDPECVDNLLGGEIKMHMEITEEHIEENENTKSNTDEFNRIHDNDSKDNQYDDSVKADTNYDTNNRVERSNNTSDNNGITETEDSVKADIVDDTLYRNTETGNVNGG